MAVIYYVGEQQDWLYLQMIRREDPELWRATCALVQAQGEAEALPEFTPAA